MELHQAQPEDLPPVVPLDDPGPRTQLLESLQFAHLCHRDSPGGGGELDFTRLVSVVSPLTKHQGVERTCKLCWAGPRLAQSAHPAVAV